MALLTLYVQTDATIVTGVKNIRLALNMPLYLQESKTTICTYWSQGPPSVLTGVKDHHLYLLESKTNVCTSGVKEHCLYFLESKTKDSSPYLLESKTLAL